MGIHQKKSEEFLGEVILILMSNKSIGYSMGITNKVITGGELGGHAYIMFYDLDYNLDQYKKKEMDLVLSLFENDCLLFKTTKGFQLVSLTVCTLANPIQKVQRISKKLDEDYKTDLDYLTLRVNPKRRISNDKIYKHRPYFVKMLKEPEKGTYCSKAHLSFYLKMIPKTRRTEILNIYQNKCRIIDCRTEIVYYETNN